MRRTIEALIVLTLLGNCSLVLAQTSVDVSIKKWLWIQKEVRETRLNSITNLRNKLLFLQSIVNGDKEVGTHTNLTLDFTKFGIRFYKFSATGRSVEATYYSFLGVDTLGDITEVEEPAKTANEVLEDIKDVDSTTFVDLVDLYERLEFVGRDVKFVDSYDSSVFGSKLDYDRFNKVSERSNGDFHFLKIYVELNPESKDVCTIMYALKGHKFLVRETLRYRMPRL